jgi:DNA-binding NtrC family response regulator
MHILQVAYDWGLLKTRAILLERSGYRVTSVFGNDNARRTTSETLSSVDLVLIGFSTAYALRTGIVRWFKEHLPTVPVVVLQFHSYEKFPEADAATLSEDPEVWLGAVRGCLPQAE